MANGKLATDKPNSAILDAIRGIASTDYQRRIPATDTAGIASTIENLTKPENRQWMNEFMDALVNRIGMTIARSNSWSNPLAPFKRGMLEFGNTIEEIQVGLLEAHGYDPDRDYMEKTLFGRERPETQVNFHTINRQDMYKVTVNPDLLRRAFLAESGLSGFVNQLMEAPTTSDQWDEFLLMSSLFKEYEHNGGFYHVNVPDVANLNSTGDDARMALRKMRAMAGNLKFLSTEYNAAKMPVFAQPDDLMLFVTPEFNAAIDVEALAGAFNIDRAQMHGKIVELPESAIGVDGAQAIMTTSDFFVIADTTFESTNQWNPASLHNNYFLHHHQVISASRFVPAVMFTTGADDEVITIRTNITGISDITFESVDGVTPTGVERGGMVALVAEAESTPEGANAVSWGVTGNTSGRTFITQFGVLHVAPDETATSLTVTASTAGVDYENTRENPFTATLAVPVTGDPFGGWPVTTGTLSGITIKGEPIAGVTPSTTTYAATIPTGETLTKAGVKVTTTDNADVNVSVAANAELGYTVTIVVDPSTNDAPVTYTVNVTFA